MMERLKVGQLGGREVSLGRCRDGWGGVGGFCLHVCVCLCTCVNPHLYLLNCAACVYLDETLCLFSITEEGVRTLPTLAAV